MPRPKKEKEIRRTHPVMLRFTDTEYERLSSHAEAARLPLAEYIRRQVTEKPSAILCSSMTHIIISGNMKKS